MVAVIGDDRKKDQGTLEQAPGVDRVVPILHPYKIAAREMKKERTQVKLNDQCVFGGPNVPIIAGPCSVEKRKTDYGIRPRGEASGLPCASRRRF